ncbi:hypothetical protein KIPB_005087 [Kipferlia bialata]|uniref:Uncharacterized protein n=1 Tax=Kipferlia bialata TaxID=797122 RepID=A0A9K3GI97_9EUKA|nr:hypothetical protein KIPB_005087 [Kipferlia bialata]|eukprot:g5087.t1
MASTPPPLVVGLDVDDTSMCVALSVEGGAAEPIRDWRLSALSRPIHGARVSTDMVYTCRPGEQPLGVLDLGRGAALTGKEDMFRTHGLSSLVQNGTVMAGQLPSNLTRQTVVADGLRSVRRAVSFHLATDTSLEEAVWVITVPSHWSDSTVRVWLDAAHDSGIVPEVRQGQTPRVHILTAAQAVLSGWDVSPPGSLSLRQTNDSCIVVVGGETSVDAEYMRLNQSRPFVSSGHLVSHTHTLESDFLSLVSGRVGRKGARLLQTNFSCASRVLLGFRTACEGIPSPDQGVTFMLPRELMSTVSRRRARKSGIFGEQMTLTSSDVSAVYRPTLRAIATIIDTLLGHCKYTEEATRMPSVGILLTGPLFARPHMVDGICSTFHGTVQWVHTVPHPEGAAALYGCGLGVRGMETLLSAETVSESGLSQKDRVSESSQEPEESDDPIANAASLYQAVSAPTIHDTGAAVPHESGAPAIPLEQHRPATTPTLGPTSNPYQHSYSGKTVTGMPDTVPTPDTTSQSLPEPSDMGAMLSAIQSEAYPLEALSTILHSMSDLLKTGAHQITALNKAQGHIPILRLMAHNLGDSGVFTEGARALCSMTYGEAGKVGKEAVAKSGGATLVVSGMKLYADMEEACTVALGCLGNLANYGASVSGVREAQCESIVTTAMGQYPMHVKVTLYGASLLTSLASAASPSQTLRLSSAVPILVSAIRNHPSHLLISKYAIAALGNIAFPVPVLTLFDSESYIDTIMESCHRWMATSPNSVPCIALLGNLARSRGALSAMAALGLMPLLTSTLASPDTDTESMCHCLMAITNIAKYDRSVLQDDTHLAVLRAVVERMIDSKPVLMEGCDALANLSSSSSQIQVDLSAAGAVPSLKVALATFKEDGDVCGRILKVFVNLSQHEGTRESLEELSCPDIVLSVAKRHSGVPLVVESTAIFFGNMVVGATAARAVRLGSPAIQVLVSTATSQMQDTSVVVALMRLFRNLANRDPTRKALFQHRAHTLTLDIMRSHLDSEVVMGQGAGVLQNMALSDKTGGSQASVLAGCGTVSLVSSCLQREGVPASQQASLLSILRNMASQEPLRPVLFHHGCHSLALTALRQCSSNRAVQTAGLWVLGLMSQGDPVRCSSIQEAGAQDVICAALHTHSQDRAVCYAGLKGLLALSEGGSDLENCKAAANLVLQAHPNDRDIEPLTREITGREAPTKDVQMGGNVPKVHEGVTEPEGLVKVLERRETDAALLEELYLNDNAISDIGVKALCTVLPSLNSLTRLFLGTNCIGDNGAKALAASLPSLPLLSQLYLRGNISIGHIGASAIREAVPDGCSVLF